MQVLTSGSFINLDNEEKIEQLIFTAKEIAVAALAADGYTNEEESNRKFADEIWQSAEYMCREHEEALIRTIFVNAFLERLREHRGSTAATNSAVDISEKVSQEIVTESARESESPTDEFLGFVPTEINGENDESHEQSSIQKSASQMFDIENEVTRQENEFEETCAADEEDLKFALPEQPTSSLPGSIEVIETETEKIQPETERDEANQEKAVADNESTPKTVAGGAVLRLPEKEPYQFDKCTVTATIQLFPTSENQASRKAVLSVRTHDFAPQISMVELVGKDLPAALAPELEKVLAKYQSDLPAKVMDKLKKEKNAPKKQVKSPATETKSAATATATTAKENTAKVSPAEDKQPAQRTVAASVSSPRDAGQQGSLFG